LNWKPAPSIQTVGSIKIKIVEVEYFPLQFPRPHPCKNKIGAGNPPSPPKILQTEEVPLPIMVLKA